MSARFPSTFIAIIRRTINDAEQTHFAASVMEEVVGEENVNATVEPTMGAEDFAFMLLGKPGCYAFLGNGEGEHRDTGHGLGPCMLHNASYDFNDALLSVGSTYWVRLAERFLSRWSGIKRRAEWVSRVECQCARFAEAGVFF